MAFQIPYSARGNDPRFTLLSRFHVDLADQAGTTAAQDAVVKVGNVQAIILQKTFTSGSGSDDPVYTIEMADDSGFTTNVVELGSVVVRRGSNQVGEIQSTFNPNGPQEFIRVRQDMSGTDSATFDAMLDAS